MMGNEARERERDLEREGEQHSGGRKRRGSFEKTEWVDLTVGLNQQHLSMS
jgi:hypothetical protein